MINNKENKYEGISHKDILLEGIEAVIFDIDGTLVDSMGVWVEVDRIYLGRYGIEMPPDLQKILSGISIKETADYFREVFGINDTTEKMLSDWNELAYEQYHDHVKAKPYSLRWVEDLGRMGIKMAVGTSNTRRLACTAMEVQGFRPYFEFMITGEDVIKGKPDPFIYQECARRLGVDPKKCLVFEDVTAGIIAGRDAGMKTCAVRDDFSLFEDFDKRQLADYYIESFEDIYMNRVVINEKDHN